MDVFINLLLGFILGSATTIMVLVEIAKRWKSKQNVKE